MMPVVMLGAFYMIDVWLQNKHQEEIQSRMLLCAKGYPLACKECCSHVYCQLMRNSEKL